ncbi:two-component regulator propeller domain-containing protein [Muribaculum intestinale]|uniref:two-component regulator propeller domain-containing protein n=1 Tax=Muribaculum intestinale TaxID=1796646 RepID=UPI0025A9FFA1|nr:two-component regulator propeller domain-containing protein [Muribaculum intestinale]
MKRVMLIIVLLISVGSIIYCGNPSVQPISEVLRLDNTTGLSSQKVYSFVEDKNGAIWISTKAGIDRYNGRILKNYSLEDNSFYGGMGGRIIRLYIDEDTLFAYDSSGKIYKYSEIYDSFEPILNLADSLNADVMLNKVLPCREQILYATNNGLFVNIPGKGIKSVIPDIYANDK